MKSQTLKQWNRKWLFIQTALILFGGLLCAATVVMAADVTMKWDPVAGADGYRIEMSLDQGVTWDSPGVDVGNVTQYTYVGVAETGLVMFRMVVYATGKQDQISTWMGAWYDHTKRPLDPTEGLGALTE